MASWSRPIGLALSTLLVAALVYVGLRGGGEGSPAPPDLRNGQAFIQPNLWSTAGRQYAVWVAPDGTPFAGVRDRDGDDWSVSDLARINGNPLAAPTADDDHDVYAIAADREGGVHVAGNMHADPLRYARSGPEGFGSWAKRPAPPAAGLVTYPAFTALPDGTLLFWYRLGEAGSGRIALDSLAPGARRWRSLGVVIDGRPTGEGPYLNHIAVDPRSGVIHLLIEWRATEDPETTNDVSYARSTDGGRSFEASDGRPLTLPITHRDAETVIDTEASGSGLENQGGMTVDLEDRPHGVVAFADPGGGETLVHVWLEGGTWHRAQLAGLGLSGRPQLAGTPDGRVWLLGVRDGELVAIDVTPGRDPEATRELGHVPAGWEVSFDDQALARFGEVEMLVPQGSSPHVVEANLSEP
jgi:hypothetical protein